MYHVIGLLQSYLYIDGYRRQGETIWRFSDETIMTFLPWNINEPNGMHLPNPEDALILGNGFFHDAPQSHVFGFICQRSIY